MRNTTFNNFSFIDIDGHKLPLAREDMIYWQGNKPSIDWSRINKDNYFYSSELDKNHFGLDTKPYNKPTIYTPSKNQISYNNMPKGKGFYIVVHEYSDTSVGHVNLELIHNGKRISWLGANQNGINKLEPGLRGGIIDETGDSIKRIKYFPKNHSITTRQVSEKEFNIMLNRANHLFATKKDYDITDNCLHFVNDVLSHGYEKYGKGNETLSHYVKANTLANFYASLNSMGLKINDTNLKEESYKTFIQKHREQLSEHKNFLDLKLEEVRNSFKTGKIEKKPYLVASGKLVINTNNKNFDPKKYGYLNARDIYIDESKKDHTYKIKFTKNQNDIIYDGGGNDKLILNTKNHNKLWFSKEKTNLKITSLENNGSVTILDWFKEIVVKKKRKFRRSKTYRYVDKTNQIEKISTASGKSISAEQVDKLVQAMSSFSPPKNGQINLSLKQQADLSKIITTSWL